MNRGHWPGFRWSCTFLPAGDKCDGHRPPQYISCDSYYRSHFSLARRSRTG
jgi:hypothetical protein